MSTRSDRDESFEQRNDPVEQIRLNARGRLPLSSANLPQPETMFRPEHRWQMPEPLVEYVTRTSAHQVDRQVSDSRKSIEQSQQLRVGRGQLGRSGERHQRAVVIQQQSKSPCPRPQNRRLDIVT